MKLTSAGLLLGVVFLSAGCRTSQIRSEVSPILRCPESEVSVEEQREPGTYLASGCGRVAFCSHPPENGAELQCAGGADPNDLREIQPLPPAELTAKKARKPSSGAAASKPKP